MAVNPVLKARLEALVHSPPWSLKRAVVALVVQAELCRFTQLRGMQIETALVGRLLLLDWDAVGVGVGILADAGHHPG